MGTPWSCGVRRVCGAAGLRGFSTNLTFSTFLLLGQSRKSPLYRMKSGNRIATVMIYVSCPPGVWDERGWAAWSSVGFRVNGVAEGCGRP